METLNNIIIFTLGAAVGITILSFINMITKPKKIEERDDDDWLHDADYWKK